MSGKKKVECIQWKEGDALSVTQHYFIQLGYVYRNFEEQDQKWFWGFVKRTPNILKCISGVYVALVQINSIITIEELYKTDITTYDKYASWITRYEPKADNYRVRSFVKAFHTFKFLKSQ